MNATVSEFQLLDDRELLARFSRDRDEGAFEALVSRHGPMVLRVCRRTLKNEQDAEDVFQAVFLLLARKSRQVRWHSCVANWLYGVAFRIALQENRRMSKHRERELADAGEVVSRSSDELESVETERALYEEVNGLPGKYRAPLVLCHLEGKTRRQAAQELNLNETTIKGRLERARDMLRGRLLQRGFAVPSAVFSGALASQIAEGAVTKSMAVATAHAAAQFAAGCSLAGASASTASTIAKAELAKMLFAAQIKYAIITASTVAAFGTGVALVSQTSNGDHGGIDMQQPPGKASGVVVAFVDEDQAQRESDERIFEQLDPEAVSRSLRQLALGMHNFHDVNRAFPAVATYDANQYKLLSWRVHLLPYLDQHDLFSQFHLDEPWDSPHNKSLVEMMPKVFAGGSEELLESGKTVFLAPVGEDTVFGSPNSVRIQDIRDGTSNTVMIVSVKPRYAVEWTRPNDWELDGDAFEKLTGEVGQGFMFASCDGSVHRVDRTLTIEELRAWLTKSGMDAGGGF